MFGQLCGNATAHEGRRRRAHSHDGLRCREVRYTVMAVWELGEHRYVFIEGRPEHAGHARHLLFVEDLDARVARIAASGLEPAARETYPNGVCKVAYRDADGNEFGFGGATSSLPDAVTNPG